MLDYTDCIEPPISNIERSTLNEDRNTSGFVGFGRLDNLCSSFAIEDISREQGDSLVLPSIFNVDDFVKSQLPRHPGVGRDPEVTEINGFRPQLIPDPIRDRNDKKHHVITFYEFINFRYSMFYR